MRISATALGLLVSFSLSAAGMAAWAQEKKVDTEKPVKIEKKIIIKKKYGHRNVIRIDGGKDFLEHFDADEDGKVSKSEFEDEWDGDFGGDFEDFDLDGDGFLSEEEFEEHISEAVHAALKGVSKHLGRAFRGRGRDFDFDFDFDFDSEEFEEMIERRVERALRHAERGMRHVERDIHRAERGKWRHHDRDGLLERYDLDGNGELDEEELKKVKEAHKEALAKRKAVMEKHKEAMEERKKQFSERMKERRKEALDRLDEDGDGKISPEEFNKRHMERFKELDKNGDGVLSAEELEAGDWAFHMPPHHRVKRKSKSGS